MQRLDPYAISPKELQELIALHEFLDASGLEGQLIELLRARVSQINRCVSGVRRHTRGARVLGETEERLSSLPVWRSAGLYTERERAALDWAEAVTFASTSHVSDYIYAALRRWFTDAEVVKLTVIVAATNAWNRVELSFSRAPTFSSDIVLD